MVMVIAFDNFRQKIIIIVNARTEQMKKEYERAVEEIDRIIAFIKTYLPHFS